MMKRVSIAIVALASSAGAAVAGDIAAGEKSFRKCMPCHNIGETAKNSIGPIQNGLKGRKSGTVPGYSYSDANKNSGIVWDEGREGRRRFVELPRAVRTGRQEEMTNSAVVAQKSVWPQNPLAGEDHDG